MAKRGGLGMERVTPAHDTDDYETIGLTDFAVEVNTRRRIPRWLEKAVRHAERSAAEDRLPLALVRGENARRDDSLVVMRLKNFERLAGTSRAALGQAERDVPMLTAEIYTDGGCLGNPGKGAWAAVTYHGPKPTEISGVERETTNNRMELRAAIEGLKQLKEPSHVRLYSDSAYLINGMRQRWYDKWEQNGWKTAGKKPVQNADLWRDLMTLSRLHSVEWIKVAGHAGVPANERCHRLVQRAISG
jgi:ribonuclease HI